MDPTKQAIIKTIIYSDIFDFPLTAIEIYSYLITPSHRVKKTVERTLSVMSNIQKVGMYYVLPHRENLIFLRRSREIYSKKKIVVAQKIGSVLFHIPTVFFIGISGGVAMQNAEKNDDIDFFIIAKKNTVWITRLLLLGILTITGNRRRRKQIHVSNMICLNMIIDEQALAFHEKRHDLYTAHEIVQLMPLYDRYDTYQRFLSANTWVRQYLPHAYMMHKQYKKILRESFLRVFVSYILSLWVIEYLCWTLQEYIMKKHKTSEITTKHMLAFHPVNYRKKTMECYQKKVKRYVQT